MKNPDGAGNGCMLYPLSMSGCETEPLIDVHDITLNNVRSYGSILPPGVVRCDATNVCKNINFKNVTASGLWRLFGMGFLTENVEGTVKDTYPVPDFSGASFKEQEHYLEVHRSENSTQYEFDVSKMLYDNLWPYVVEFWQDNFSDEDHRKVIHKPVDPSKEYGIHVPKQEPMPEPQE